MGASKISSCLHWHMDFFSGTPNCEPQAASPSCHSDKAMPATPRCLTGAFRLRPRERAERDRFRVSGGERLRSRPGCERLRALGGAFKGNRQNTCPQLNATYATYAFFLWVRWPVDPWIIALALPLLQQEANIVAKKPAECPWCERGGAGKDELIVLQVGLLSPRPFPSWPAPGNTFLHSEPEA